MNRLPAVRTGLLTHPLDGQVLVYDTSGDRVHLLDPTTACVLELLQEGGRTPSQLTAELGKRLRTPTAAGYLELAIDQLYEAGLLDEQIVEISPLPEVNRREVIRTLVAAGIAAVALPAITSLTATVGAAQPGFSSRGVGQACGGVAVCHTGLNCCVGICRAGACNGQGCGVASDCFSGNCCSSVCSATVCAGSLAPCAACSPSGTNAACTGGTCNNQGACTSVQGGNPTGFVGCNNNNQCCSNNCLTGSPRVCA